MQPEKENNNNKKKNNTANEMNVVFCFQHFFLSLKLIIKFLMVAEQAQNNNCNGDIPNMKV